MVAILQGFVVVVVVDIILVSQQSQKCVFFG